MPRKYIKTLFTKVLLSIILFLISSIYINYSDNNLLTYKKYLYNKTFDFAFVNELYDKYLGGIVPFKNLYNEQMVMNGVVDYNNREKYEDGVKVYLNESDVIKTLKSGIVVYVGEKDNFGNTVIIQGSDGVDYWYGNLENLSVSLYDYLNDDVLIGNPKDGILYLKFVQNGEILNYEEFI